MDEIVTLTENVFTILREKTDPNVGRFSFDHVTMLPLYSVALSCREPSIRRRAIALLYEHPRGDSPLTARAEEWIQYIEAELNGVNMGMAFSEWGGSICVPWTTGKGIGWFLRRWVRCQG